MDHKAFHLVPKMDLNLYIQLIVLCVINIFFAFSGIVSNTLVIVSFWKSSQLRKKLCNFMIMVLSCFDLVAVVTSHLGILLYLISWLREELNLLSKMKTLLNISGAFLLFSFLALFVMSIERYLGAYYPIYHRTSVTRRRLLTLLAILLMPTAFMYIISRNGLVIPVVAFVLIFMTLFLPPFTFVNFKLFIIARKVHRGKRAISPAGAKTTMNFKSISTGLWMVACLMLLYIPFSFVIAVTLAEKSLNTVRLSHMWELTCITMNSTLNSLIFFWKNKVLRTEGIKILKILKDRLVGS